MQVSESESLSIPADREPSTFGYSSILLPRSREGGSPILDFTSPETSENDKGGEEAETSIVSTPRMTRDAVTASPLSDIDNSETEDTCTKSEITMASTGTVKNKAKGNRGKKMTKDSEHCDCGDPAEGKALRLASLSVNGSEIYKKLSLQTISWHNVICARNGVTSLASGKFLNIAENPKFGT